MLRIVFMGTPAFAVPSLDALIKSGFEVAGVVTAPDKPAGRGRKLNPSPVKLFARQVKLPVFQPVSLKSPGFIEQLRRLQADLFVVVAFRMLPEAVWKMPPLGCINLHASLLPQYRGAAPLNWVLINGEKETGLTTFFIDRMIDTGSIIYQEKTPIDPEETAGELHDRLMGPGATLVLKTVRSIQSGHPPSTGQDALIRPGQVLKTAPRLSRQDGRINWELPAERIFNLVRGLSPYPGAWTEGIAPGGKTLTLKIYRCETEVTAHAEKPGTILTDGHYSVKVAAGKGFVLITELQQAGRKRMSATEFLRGMHDPEQYTLGS